jgi:hypothetical protein
MKVTTILAAAPIAASASVLRERQQSSMFQNVGTNVLGGFANYAKVAAVENLPPKMFPGYGDRVRRTVTRYGRKYLYMSMIQVSFSKILYSIYNVPG